jgi:predicted secreted protein
VGRSDWSADGESILMIDPDSEQLEPAVRELFLSLAEGTKIDVEISLPGNVTFTGTAIVASLDFGAPDNDAATSSWEVEGDGPLTLTEGGIAAN